ncbi:uncharacterized protein LOC134829346 [Culicoides brevitarsis]|uniref:uncharacterized protein LOC134829346 n=1 Tax=Culicoides brevitarsis TaxID=469753 RepID=UPI00307C5AEB
MSWTRPSNIPFPSVWHTFKAKDLDSDELVEYRVQDMPPEYHQKAMDLMQFDFLRDEVLCASTEISKDEVSLKEILELWQQMLKGNTVLACFRENSDELVGLNMVMVETKDNPESKDYDKKIRGEKWKIVYGAVKELINRCNVFEKYNVDKYLGAMGLSVDTKYRGRGIGVEILKARVPMCKALGISLTSTVFTGIASQKQAIRAGFTDDVEVDYSELNRLGYHLPGVKVKSIKLMSLEIK